MADILKDNIVKDIQRKIGSDQENFTPTEETSAKEAELMTLTVNLVLGVIKLARGFRNSEKKCKEGQTVHYHLHHLVPPAGCLQGLQGAVKQGPHPWELLQEASQGLQGHHHDATPGEVHRVLTEVFMPVSIAEFI